MRIVILTATAGLAAYPAVAQTQERPNILWVMAEDMGQDLECYGMQAVKTPVLNKMAREGIMYTNSFCSNPISSPSRSAMMTGVHQTVINAHNHRSNRDQPLANNIMPITYWLREAGYTCILGNSNVMGKGRKTDCNFKHKPIGEWNGTDRFGLFDKYDGFTAEDQPFFAQIQLNVTHRGDHWKKISAESAHPVDPDKVELPPYLADHPQIRKEWACYLDQVEYMDKEMGMILKDLENKGLLDNTVIFFIADNGRCEIKGKGYLYDTGIRIPMIAWGKGIKPAVIDDIVSTMDISATILDMAGAYMPDYLTGQPLFEDGKPIRNDREYFYSARDTWDEVKECMRNITTKKYSYIRNMMPEKGWDRHQTYLEFHRPAIHVMRSLKKEGRLNSGQLLFFEDCKPAEELYDLEKDPHQMHNLAEDPSMKKVLDKMRGMMKDWLDNHKDLGLEDFGSRKDGSQGEILDYVQTRYPEEWEKITKGDICDCYQKWNSEVSKKNAKPTDP